ncbi:Fanconi anemia_ complementation group I, partial [Caligus rogercresseyi]
NEPLILEELLSKGSKAPGFKDLKVSLLESLLSRLFFEDSPPRLCEVLLNELDELSLEQLSSFSTSVLDVLKDPARDLRESCVSIVGKASSSLLNSLCSSPWRPSNAIILASIFRSTQLKGEALLLILDKITDLMSSLTPDLIPPLVHQVLHLSVSSADSNAPLLKALQSFYAKALRRASNDSQRSVIYHSRDTTLLHILQSIKIGHSISSHLLKLLRSLDYRCLHDPFILFNCLSITSVKHIRKQALDGLKSLILKHVEFNTKAFKIGWLIELGDKFPGTFQKTALDLISTSIRLGDGASYKMDPRNDVHLSQVWNLATAILSQTLHDSPDSAEMYIKEISIYKILSPDHSGELERLPSEYDIPNVTPGSTRRIISAFQPLFKRSRLLRDQLIMIFRKALFSSSEDSRQIAILGVLELIKCFKLSVSSQNSMSVLSQSSGSLMTQSVVDIQSGVQLSNESICIELLSVLKRGFTQQATIRKTIYKELCQVLMLNPEICNSCLDILYQQSVVNKIKSSVDVGKLITNDRVYEPAGWFLHCTQYTITRGQELYKSSEDVVASLDKLSKMLHDLTENYSKIDDTDLQIESGQSFLHAETLQNIYESLIEFCVMNGETSEYKLSKIKSLFQKYKSIEVPVE